MFYYIVIILIWNKQGYFGQDVIQGLENVDGFKSILLVHSKVMMQKNIFLTYRKHHKIWKCFNWQKSIQSSQCAMLKLIEFT